MDTIITILTYPIGAFQAWHIILVLGIGGFWLWYEKVETDPFYTEYLREKERRDWLETIRMDKYRPPIVKKRED